MGPDRHISSAPDTRQAERGPRPERGDCLEQLDRMVRQGALSPEARSYALLAYLIEHFLTSAPGATLKAYAIAIDVLGRSAGFDPAQDSIVRVEIGRLRKLLEMYFLGPGRNDPVWFCIPKGQTHLNVRYHRDPPQPDGAHPPRPTAARSRGRGLLVVLAVCMMAMGLSIWNLTGVGDAEIAAALDDDYPRVFVQPFTKRGGLDQTFPDSGLSAFIATELSAYHNFRVIAPLPKTTLPVRPRDYVLIGDIVPQTEGAAQQLVVSLSLRDGVGTVLWTERLSLTVSEPDAPAPVFAALSEIASTLGGAMGVIDSDGRARLTDEQREWAKGDESDFRCILRWQSFDLTKDPQDRAVARRCLEDRAARGTPVGQIWSALAFLRFLEWSAKGAHPEDSIIDTALAAANRALLLDPNGPDGHEALGSILTGLGRFQEAQDVLARALDLNPSNLDTAVKLGWLDCLNGDWATGVARIGRVIDRYDAVPGWYRLPLALAAFDAGDADALLRQSQAITTAGDPRGLVLALVGSRLAHDAEDERRRRLALQQAGLDPVWAIAEIAAVFPDPDLIARLRATVVDGG